MCPALCRDLINNRACYTNWNGMSSFWVRQEEFPHVTTSRCLTNTSLHLFWPGNERPGSSVHLPAVWFHPGHFPRLSLELSNKNEGVEQIIAEAIELRDLDCGVLVPRIMLLGLLHNNNMIKRIYSTYIYDPLSGIYVTTCSVACARTFITVLFVEAQN